MSERGSKAGKLAVLEVPRVSVNLMSDDLTGHQKLTILKYLALDDAITELGSQRFGKRVVDAIPLKPIREWVSQNWTSDFAVDLSKRNLPISFRTSLALALFTTTIADHLSRIEGGVEIYASEGIQGVFERHKLPVPFGTTTIDYASLPNEVKNDLVQPIVDNLKKAEMVAHAKPLFPQGIPGQVIMLADASTLMELTMTGYMDKTVKFDSIRDLEIQELAARVGIKHYHELSQLRQIARQIKKVKAAEKPRTNTTEVTEATEEPVHLLDFDPNQLITEPDIHFEDGTTFTQIFKYEEGENPEDVLRAFRRITHGGAYRGIVDEPHRGEFFNVYIDEKGRLRGDYGYREMSWSVRDPDDADYLEEIDMLSGRLKYPVAENNRRTTLQQLCRDIADDVQTNKQAITLAQARYGQTSFTVELGFLLALTGDAPNEATKKDIEEDKRLAKEAKKMAGQLTGEPIEDSTGLTVYSDHPVDMRTVELDYRILQAIKDNYHMSTRQLNQMLFSLDRVHHFDNIGDWMGGCSSLLTRFHSVVANVGDLFLTLGIPPTNDEREIRNAYFKIANACHPDKLPDAAPEDKLAAQERFIQAGRAYTDIKSRLGRSDLSRLAPTYYLGRISKLFENTDTP